MNWQNFYQEVSKPEQNINLAKACLYFSQIKYPEIRVREYLSKLDKMAWEAKKYLPKNNYPLKIIQGINTYLFQELGLQGNQDNYYDPRNSFLNEVINRKRGIPITLSVVYLEIAKRLKFPMVGIGMPGHFIIRPEFQDAGIFVDVYNRGDILFEQDCYDKIRQLYPEENEIDPNVLAPVNNKQILARILTNLKYIYLNNDQLSQALMIIEGLIILYPNNISERRDRGLLCYSLQQWEQAIADLELYLKMSPNAEDRLAIQQLLDKIKYN
jgi:regulator of sirC expression with transglutaminase-like and TPR domain